MAGKRGICTPVGLRRSNSRADVYFHSCGKIKIIQYNNPWSVVGFDHILAIFLNRVYDLLLTFHPKLDAPFDLSKNIVLMQIVGS